MESLSTHGGYRVLKCAECNKEFVLNRKDKKFCSRKCYRLFWNKLHKEYAQEYSRKTASEDKIKKGLSEPRKCINCGNSFIPLREDHRSCSIKCHYDKWSELRKSTPIRHVCHQCGKEFYTPVNGSVFCSNECKKNSVTYRIRADMGHRIRKVIRRERNGVNYTNGELAYTESQLRKHLEKQFVDGMTWENYGKWHVDHIIPKSHFKYVSTDDPEFKKCWALDNLQPLDGIENMRKGDRIVALIDKQI